MVSRLLGFLRLAAIAAVLGPTFLGNAYQSANVVPNLLFEFFTGSLLATLLVPALVHAFDAGGRPAADRLAGTFFAVAIAGFAAVVMLAVILIPFLAAALTAGVDHAGLQDRQRSVTGHLLVCVLPQIFFYGVAGVGAAAQNAAGRFALAAAAPAVESLGVIATLVALRLLYPENLSLGAIPTPAVLLLGLGSTSAVVLHAAVQWWGAWRAGLTLVPRGGWRRPEVSAVLARLRPSMVYAGMNLVRVFAALVVANAVEGGAVAFTIALGFYYLPVAVGARPVGLALLPRLSRLRRTGPAEEVRDAAVRGSALAAFLVVPCALAYAALCVPLSHAVTFGDMASARGVTLVAVGLAALAPGVVGEAFFVVGTHVAYALEDARAPVRAMLVRTVVSLAGLAVTFFALDGTLVVAGIGLSISAGNLLGAVLLARGLRLELPHGRERLWPPMRRAVGAAALMVAPAYGLAVAVPRLVGGQASDLVGLLAGTSLGAAVFLEAQRRWKSPELAVLASGVRRRRARGEGA